LLALRAGVIYFLAGVIEMERVVLQRDEAVLLVESLRVVILGEQVDREHTNPLRHVAGRFQEVKEKELAQTLAPASEIDGKPTKVSRGQRVSGESRNVPADEA
jgi:hypothetical protein